MSGSQALLEAIKRDDQEAVVAAAFEDADACERNGQPWSCLAEAFALGRRGCALRLMEAMPTLSTASKQCVLRGVLEGPLDDPVLFTRLLDRGAELPLGQTVGVAIEHECAILRHPRIVDAMFKREMLKASVIDNAGWSPFLRAIHAGDTATAKVFLEHGAQINARIRTNDHPSALHLALETDDSVRVVTWLLKQGIDPETTDGRGRSAAQLAEENGQNELARLIRAHDPAAMPWGLYETVGKVYTRGIDGEAWTPFLRAIQAGNTAAAQVFLDNNADINARIEWKDRRSALHIALAVSEDPERVVRWLLDRGIEVALVDEAGRTAAQLALQRGQSELAQLITMHGGAGGPLWHREAVERGIHGVICTFSEQAAGFSFDPRLVTHPFFIGGSHDGQRDQTAREALKELPWLNRTRGLYAPAMVWLPYIERMVRGEDVGLDELLALGTFIHASGRN